MKQFSLVHAAAWILMGSILLVSATLMFKTANFDAGVMDELAHIPAGYGYVKHFDFRLNPEHPPLLKALAALPLTLVNLSFPTDHKAWTTDINGQWDMGNAFLFDSGNDADMIIRLSRLGPILLTLLLTLVIYLWAKELYGRLWAAIPALLFGLSPNVISHGHFVTTDVAAAFGIVLSAYTGVKFLESPSKKHLILAGIAFGIGQASKFSAVLLIPFLGFIFVMHLWRSVRKDWEFTAPNMRLKRFGVRTWRYARAGFFIMAIGYAFVIYPMYFAFTRNYPMDRQAAETEYLLSTYAKGPTPAGEMCSPSRCLADLNIWMAKNEFTRPMAEYMLGVLMVIQRAAGGNTAYFMGTVTNVGSRLYFPVVYVLKESLPVLIMILVSAILGFAGILHAARKREMGMRFWRYLDNHFAEFSFLSFVLLYWGYTIKSPLNIGFRHLFPSLPFIYLLIAGSWKRWIFKRHESQGLLSWHLLAFWAKEILGGVTKYLFLVILLLWFVIGTLAAAPYYLSYFNAIGGGTMEGYRYVTDSNYDWGQDMLLLQEFMHFHPEIDKLAIDFFGASRPQYYLGADKAIPWWSAKGDPRNEGIHWFAASINSLQGNIQPTSQGYQRPERDEYRWLTESRATPPGFGQVPAPDYRVGTTLFIYHLP